MKLSRTALAFGCSLGIGLPGAALPVNFGTNSQLISVSEALAQAAAPAATAKPKPKAAPKKAAPKKAAKPKAKSTKKKAKPKGKRAVKSGRAALTPAEMLDRNQFAPDLFETAKSQSPLELLASYKTTIHDGDLETAAVLLRAAAREHLTHERVVAINDMIGVTLDTQDAEVLVEVAATTRASTATELVTPDTPAHAAPTSADRISAAHAVVDAAPKISPISCLTTYRLAVQVRDAAGAAFALACATGKPANEESVALADQLLDIKADMPAGQIVAQSSGALRGTE